jgi:ParB/RepB/Spo0J family partition protein
MSGGSNRKAGFKVSGLVASGRVQVREIDDPAPAPVNESAPQSDVTLDYSLLPTLAGDAPHEVSDDASTKPHQAEAEDAASATASDKHSPDVPAAAELGHSDANGSDTPASITTRASASNVVSVPLSMVVDSPYQPRLQYDPEEVDQLAETMREATQGEPIRVRMKNGKYELISGHRRVRAARILGWTHIAAYVEVLSDVEAQAKTMVLAVGSVSLSDYELAKMFNTAIEDKLCKNQRAVASYFGFGTTKVNGCLDMLKLPRGVVRFLDARPKLFGYETAVVIKKLYAEYPDKLAEIERGVQRLTEGATQGSLKAWVLQAIKGQASSAGAEPNLITRGRRLVFTTKVHADKRAILVNCKLPDMDLAALEKDLQAWLDERAQVLSPDLPDDTSPEATGAKK